MPQNDLLLANDTGANFRADVNSALQALAARQSGGSAPGTPYSYEQWADTANGVIKRRNAANGAWVLDSTLAETFVVGKSGSYTVAITDFQTLLNCTGSFTLALTAAATLGDGFWCDVRNDGSGVITIDPNSTEQVNGATTLELYPGESCILMCTGSAWKTIGLHAPSFKIGNFARDMSTASGTQAVTGVGFKPRAVVFLATEGSTGQASIGFDLAGSARGSIYNNHVASADTWGRSGTSYSIFASQLGASHAGGVTSLDADGFTVSWVKSGSSTGTLTIDYLAMR